MTIQISEEAVVRFIAHSVEDKEIPRSIMFSFYAQRPYIAYADQIMANFRNEVLSSGLVDRSSQETAEYYVHLFGAGYHDVLMASLFELEIQGESLPIIEEEDIGKVLEKRIGGDYSQVIKERDKARSVLGRLFNWRIEGGVDGRQDIRTLVGGAREELLKTYGGSFLEGEALIEEALKRESA